MRRILFVLVVVIALAGVVAYMAPASGQADKRTRDDLTGKLARREVQRSPLSIPGREMVQVETLIPAGVESGWHVHSGEEVGQPILADDVAAALVDVTLGAPVNGIIDLAGPERFRFDEIIRQFLSATQDTRQVVIDTHARYFGAKLDEQSLIPRGNSHIGATRFKGWLSQFKGNGGVERGASSRVGNT